MDEYSERHPVHSLLEVYGVWSVTAFGGGFFGGCNAEDVVTVPLSLDQKSNTLSFKLDYFGFGEEKMKAMWQQSIDYNVIKRYKRKQIGRKYKLFRKDLLVVRQDKCFGILWSIHVEKGHAGRNIMLKEIKSRGYGGLSNDVVLAFLSCCEFCKLKQGKIKRGVIVKPMVEKQFNDRAQCDLIDFTSKPDGDFHDPLSSSFWC
ncbi:KRAB-A domain-containing protein 2-like protein [Aphelenchoides besseyi]|nr:KRAB-A domain-containing protein 2-like protein [Aphelenchoides besseyi]